MKYASILGAVLATASMSSRAATWSIGNGSASPGQTVQISLSFAGDGLAHAAEINLTFDEAQLSLPMFANGCE